MADTDSTVVPGPVQLNGAHINGDRLSARLEALAEIGAIDGGGCARLALTDEDRAGRNPGAAEVRGRGSEATSAPVSDRIGHCRNSSDGRPGDGEPRDPPLVKRH